MTTVRGRQHGPEDELHRVVGLVALLLLRRQDLGPHRPALRPHRPLQRRHLALLLHARAAGPQLRQAGQAHAHPLRGRPRDAGRGVCGAREGVRRLQVRRPRRHAARQARRVTRGMGLAIGMNISLSKFLSFRRNFPTPSHDASRLGGGNIATKRPASPPSRPPPPALRPGG